VRSNGLPTRGRRVTVEVLYFDGCPNHESLLPRLREALAQADVAAELEQRSITDAQTARRERFLGSPTVRVDGRDVEPDAELRSDFGVKCRLYRTTAGLVGQPPQEWLLAALRAHRGDRGTRA
jgi:hypothetical protein